MTVKARGTFKTQTGLFRNLWFIVPQVRQSCCSSLTEKRCGTWVLGPRGWEHAPLWTEKSLVSARRIPIFPTFSSNTGILRSISHQQVAAALRLHRHPHFRSAGSKSCFYVVLIFFLCLLKNVPLLTITAEKQCFWNGDELSGDSRLKQSVCANQWVCLIWGVPPGGGFLALHAGTETIQPLKSKQW